MNRLGTLFLLLLCAVLWAAGPRTKNPRDVLDLLYRSVELDVAHVEALPKGDRDAVVCTAVAIYHEARGEAEERGRMGIAVSVRNRTRERAMTACEVVWEPYQYEWSSNPLAAQIPRDTMTFRRSLREAYRVLVDGEMSGVRWNHFWGHRVLTPGWSRGCVERVRIGFHTFCYIPPRRWRQ